MTIPEKLEKLINIYGSIEMLAAKLGTTTMSVYRWKDSKVKPISIFRKKIDLFYMRNFENGKN